MKYENVTEGIFVSRPNRFIAVVEVNGKEEICHVKNTGRCRELLIPGVKVILEKSDSETRKTKYDLISVYKGNKLINIDSQAPNKVFFEYLKCGKLFNAAYIKPEAKYKNSRFDFYVEEKNKKIFIEIKGVTLEKNGIFMFPDAPTIRGIKHINELIECKKEGYEAYLVFIIQADFGNGFTPDKEIHKDFYDVVLKAGKKGVNILCYNCEISENSLSIKEKVNLLI